MVRVLNRTKERMMRQVIKKVFQTDDGAIFNTIQEAHDYLDQTYQTALVKVAKELYQVTGTTDIAKTLDAHINDLVSAKQIMLDKKLEPVEQVEKCE